MFIKAIEKVDKFTRPLHIISRNYAGLVTPGTATFFFVNDEGVAITCKHVLDLIAHSNVINQQFCEFKGELAGLPKDSKFKKNMKGLELKYNFKNETNVQIKNQFLNCFDSVCDVKYLVHPTLDLALIRFEGFKNKLYNSHATFVSDPNKIKQGKYLCRLGYPFPEFSNFQYNQLTDDIEWTETGIQSSPRFPLDGIITRFVADTSGQIVAIELSTPGLKGQSGGPLFDTNGLVYGMQSATNHLHLGFDIKDKEVLSDGKKIKVSNSPFLHVGHCIHVDRIKEFLKQQNIKFYEE